MQSEESNILIANRGKILFQAENSIYSCKQLLYEGVTYLYVRYKMVMHYTMIEGQNRKFETYGNNPIFASIFPYSKTHSKYDNKIPEELIWTKGVPLIHLIAEPLFQYNVYDHCRVILTRYAQAFSKSNVIHGGISPYSILYSMDTGICHIMNINSIYIDGSRMPISYAPDTRLCDQFHAPEISKLQNSNCPKETDAYSLGLSLLYAILVAQGADLDILEKRRIELSGDQSFLQTIIDLIKMPVNNSEASFVIKALFMMIQPNPTDRIVASDLINYKLKELYCAPLFPGIEIKCLQELPSNKKLERTREIIPGKKYIAYNSKKAYIFKTKDGFSQREFNFIKNNRELLHVFKYYEAPNYYYYKCEGINMKQKFMSLPKTQENFINMIFAFSSIISTLNKCKIVHGCLCPTNILEDKISRIIFAEFSSAFTPPTFAPFNKANANCYTAPELLSSQNGIASAESDIYSLGITFLSILTNTYNEEQLMHGIFENGKLRILRCTKEYNQTSIISIPFIIKSLRKYQNKFEGVSDDLFKKLCELIIRMICENPTQRESLSKVEETLKSLIPKKVANNASTILSPWIPKESVNIKHLLSQYSENANDIINVLGEITEILKLNKNVFLINSIQNGAKRSNILKRFEKSTLLNNEIAVLEKAKQSKKEVSRLYPTLLYKRDKKPYFIIIEYCGIDIGQYYMKKKFDDALLNDILCLTYDLISSLVDLEMYHGDIRIENIIKNKSTNKFIDFELSIINPEINNEYEEITARIPGFSPQYAPPEILSNFYHNQVQICARKADIYCLAKCILLIISRLIRQPPEEALKTWFGIEPYDIIRCIQFQDYERLGKLMVEKHKNLIEFVKNLKCPFVGKQITPFKFQKLTQLLTKMLDQDPIMRVQSKEVRDEINSIIQME